MKQHDLMFMYDKETKGAVRYKEVQHRDRSFVVGTLYIRKQFLETGRPDRLTVTIKAES